MQSEPEVLSPESVAADAPFPCEGSTATTDAIVGDPLRPATYAVVDEDAAEQIANRDDVIARQAAEIKALHKQIATEKQIAEEMEDARRDWEDLKERAKEAKERMDTLAEALSKRVRGDVQTEVGEFREDGAKQTTIDDAIAAPAAAQQMNGGDVLTIPDMDWAAVELAALSAVSSLGKPPQVRPYQTKTGNLLVLTNVSRPIAVLHELLDAKTFAKRYPNATAHDIPSDAFDGVQLLGYPVRVGRKKLWLGSNDDAWHVSIPDEVKITESAGVMDDSGDGDPNAGADDADQDESAQ